MIKPFEFYFDFSSPYTFLAHKEIKKIEKENSIKDDLKKEPTMLMIKVFLMPPLL